MLDALTFAERVDDTPLTRLARLRAQRDAAAALKGDPDKEVAERARIAGEFAQAERDKVALIGAEEPIVSELLGAKDVETKSRSATRDNVSVYWTVGPTSRCSGLYLVGSEKGARLLNDPGHRATTTKLLSQALGHSVALPAIPAAVGGRVPSSSTWRDGAVVVTARWSDDRLMELRIGDAKP
jgi:hypothetical protein